LSIETDSANIEKYVEMLFAKIEGHEQEFIDNLSQPLLRNPLEILMHLQNVIYDLEDDMSMYQQSVLAVDVYLDIE